MHCYLKKVNSCSKIINKNKQSKFRIPCNSSNSSKNKSPFHFISLTNIPHLPKLVCNKKNVMHQRNLQISTGLFDSTKNHFKHRQRNILKFQSKAYKIQEKIKLMRHRQTNQQICSNGGEFQKRQYKKRAIISLKTIKSVQNMIMSPQQQSSSNILQSFENTQKNCKENLLEIRNLTFLQMKRNIKNIKRTLQGQTKAHHNTSIITQSKVKKQNIRPAEIRENDKVNKNIYHTQKNNQNQQNNKKSLLNSQKSTPKSQRAKWQSISVDEFQQKLCGLMLKVKKSSIQRIKLIRIASFKNLTAFVGQSI